MTSVNEMNAVTREQARIREVVVDIEMVELGTSADGQPVQYVALADVLEAIRGGMRVEVGFKVHEVKDGEVIDADLLEVSVVDIDNPKGFVG